MKAAVTYWCSLNTSASVGTEVEADAIVGELIDARARVVLIAITAEVIGASRIEGNEHDIALFGCACQLGGDEHGKKEPFAETHVSPLCLIRSRERHWPNLRMLSMRITRSVG
jgi:hypothetical protein